MRVKEREDKTQQGVQHRPLRRFVYRVLMALIRVFIKLLFGLRVRNRVNVPLRGGVIIAPNHPTYLDPLFIGAALPRYVSFVAKRLVFRIPVLRTFLWLDESIPIREFSADVGAIRKCIRRLKAGDAVVIFPEGTRSNYGHLRPGLPGVALIAMLSGAPIIPCAIVNAYPAWRLSAPLPRPHWRVEVRFGEPINVEQCHGDKRDAILDDVTRRLMHIIRQLGEDEL